MPNALIKRQVIVNRTLAYVLALDTIVSATMTMCKTTT
jgi:hypothetical protein